MNEPPWRGPRTYIVRQINAHAWDLLVKTVCEDGMVMYTWPFPSAQRCANRQMAEGYMRRQITGDWSTRLEGLDPPHHYEAHYDDVGRLIEEVGEPEIPICARAVS